MMRFLVFVMFFMPLICRGDTIPPRLAKQIKVYQTEDSDLHDGVLRIRFSSPIITQNIYRPFVNVLCMPLMLVDSKKNDPWDGAKINRIELINQIGAQGFALNDVRKSCLATSHLTYDEAKTYIANRTWVCVAGNPCRPRRDGEITSGDE